MRQRNLPALVFTLLLAASQLSAATKPAPKPETPKLPTIDIPYRMFKLQNGLTLIVHEDHKAPVVAVNVWYHVGSKNEAPGKTGFAHLFEHLMFNGSEHFNDDYFQVLERIGATDLNGTTYYDRTNYFQTIPVSALDTVLWMESDRMGYMVGAIDKAKLDEQRGVVQNEKRQDENEPYAIADELITKATFPADHPYGHTVIGSMEDLNAASLDDVKNWFKTYYGPSNAVVVIAGDIDTETAKQKVEKFFGEIPPGPPVAHFKEWVAKRHGEERQVAEDRVPQARIYKVWNVPGTTSADSDLLSLISDILVSDKTSRLYKRLVYDDQTATSVSAYLDEREIASLFTIEATVKPGVDPAKVENAINEEMARLLNDGPTQAELDRIRTRDFSDFVRGVERVGGFGGKSDILASGFIYENNPAAYKETLDTWRAATTAALQKTAREWLSDGVYTLTIVPFPDLAQASTAVDRKKMPEPGEPPAPQFPAIQSATLSNGLKILLAERHTVPVVNLSLMLDAGYASDQFALPGTASLAMNMIDEGTKSRSALEISRELSSLGAQLSTGSNLDMSFVNLSALKTTLDPALNLFADVVLNPAFPQADFNRLQQLQLAAIRREKSEPISMALRVFPRLLYGAGHAYSTPFTGSGTEESVMKISRADLAKFHQTWFKPNNATVVVAGDTTMSEIQPKLEKLFSGWSRGNVPAKNIGTVALPAKPTIYLVDKPGAIQSVILAGNVAPPKANPEEIGIEAMNTILGGAFISRLNMNLREAKHWTYGAGSFLAGARGQRPFIAYAPVQTDKTKESMIEVAKELHQILKDKTITADEASMARANMTLTLPGSWETANDVQSAIGDIVRYALPMDYYSTYAGRVKAVTVEQMNSAATTVVHPDQMVWVVVGDRAKIEKDIRDLNMGEVRLIDADGNPVK